MCGRACLSKVCTSLLGLQHCYAKLLKRVAWVLHGSKLQHVHLNYHLVRLRACGYDCVAPINLDANAAGPIAAIRSYSVAYGEPPHSACTGGWNEGGPHLAVKGCRFRDLNDVLSSLAARMSSPSDQTRAVHFRQVNPQPGLSLQTPFIVFAVQPRPRRMMSCCRWPLRGLCLSAKQPGANCTQQQFMHVRVP